MESAVKDMSTIDKRDFKKGIVNIFFPVLPVFFSSMQIKRI
jgi:hypothetical protein